MPTICIFCGSKKGNSKEMTEDIISFCELISQSGFDLVYGGSFYGTMGLVAEIFRKNHRKVIGVRPKMYLKSELASTKDGELLFTDNMALRKQKMLELADVIVALPGGIGTLDEITEAHCLASTGQISKFIGILNSQNFYSGLLVQYQLIEKFGFTSKNILDSITIEEKPEVLAERILERLRE